MNSKSKLLILRTVSVILLLSVAVTIFTLSSHNSQKSSKESGRVTKIICKIVYPDFNEKPKDVQDKIIKKFHTPVRKAAHFTLFFLLGAAAFLSIVSYSEINYFLRTAAGFLFSVLYAVSDEIHQSFVAGRGPQVKDVLIDSTGILTATVILALVFSSNKVKVFFGMEEK